MSVVYIGAFPPGYGGVTIKNQNLYSALKDCIEIDKVDLNIVKKGNIREGVRLITKLLNKHNSFVIGVSGRKTRKRFCSLLYHINRSSMKRSLLIVMGGTASNDMAKDKTYGKYVKEYKTIYVETNGMKKTLLDVGITNVDIYPNGRFRPKHLIDSNTSGKLKCVFFSKICEQKGCTEILDAARKMDTVQFAFYGEIDKSYVEFFMKRIDELKNADYYGVFAGSPEDVYRELSNYDVLLFPTKYTIEGVPGILVEAKISGMTIIASDASYNREIVQDGENGFILDQITADCLSAKIGIYDKDRELLKRHRQKSLNSANAFFIDKYISNIVVDLGEG